MTSLATSAPGPAAETSAARRFAATNDASERFFGANADAIAHACEAMAHRFDNGGRLLVRGDGAQRSDGAHVVVEFVHPVIVGKRALPAMALPGDDDAEALALLSVLGRGRDIFMLLCAGTPTDLQARLLARAHSDGMLTIALTGAAGDPVSPPQCDFLLSVPSHDPCVVQEAHEMLYHVLWELVHVFFEHRSVSA